MLLVALLVCLTLQEAEITNAGMGSNLTLDGSVEADASIMLGNNTFAAIGAAPGLHQSPCLTIIMSATLLNLQYLS